MKKVKVAGLVTVLVALIIGGVFFLVGYLRPKGAGISIETNPPATIFIDGAQVGRTPYEEVRKAGEVVVKLVPDSFETPLAPYETRVTLASGVKTVIMREFGESADTSSGEIISFERVGGDEASLAVVSIPDVAQISIDGQIRGFAPYKISSLSPGEHELTISLSGYVQKTLFVRTYPGHKLTAVVKLAPSGEVPKEDEVKEEEVLAEEEERIEVEILPTGVGFLRVRSEPSTLAEELARVTPGERYRFLEEDGDTGWFKIEYEEGKEGWISGQYAKKAEEEEISPSPSPTASPSATPTTAPTS